jgi:large subunit ribosomal protein L24
MNIKKGDQVKIMNGKDRGKTGSVIRVIGKEGKIVIEGVSQYKKRSRPKKQGQKGETVLVSSPVYASKVMIVCKNCKNPTRVGFRLSSGQKSRYCKKCGVET